MFCALVLGYLVVEHSQLQRFYLFLFSFIFDSKIMPCNNVLASNFCQIVTYLTIFKHLQQIHIHSKYFLHAIFKKLTFQFVHMYICLSQL